MISKYPRLRLLLLAASLVFTGGNAQAAKLPNGFAPLQDYTPADLGPKETQFEVIFPAAARGRTVMQGIARVAVLVDESGKPMDFLITAHDHPSFGDALLDELKHRTFRPAMLKGTAIPGRTEVSYRFEQSAGVSALDEMAINTKRGDQPAYAAQPEGSLDQPLELTGAVLPTIPPELAGEAKAGKPVRVYVTFYVDEKGHVKIPQAESAASPLLVRPALRAIYKWTFKPPTMKGKPVLAFAGRPVRFLTEQEAQQGEK